MNAPRTAAPFVTLALWALGATGPLSSSGCGEPGVRWRDEMAVWFNNSSVTPPEPDRRYWTRRDQEVLLRRLGYADVAAFGRVNLVNTMEAQGGARRIAVSFTPIKVLHGSFEGLLDAGDELLLPIGAGQLDFVYALSRTPRLPGQRYLLFVKRRPADRQTRARKGWRGSLWYPNENAERFNWALYGPDPVLLGEVEAIYRQHRKR